MQNTNEEGREALGQACPAVKRGVIDRETLPLHCLVFSPDLQIVNWIL